MSSRVLRPTLPPVPAAFDWEAFRQDAKLVADDIADLYKSMPTRPVQAAVVPGYLREKLPATPPEAPSDLTAFRQQWHDVIVPGLTHWQHPGFFAFFPAIGAPPALLADSLATAANGPNFNWMSCPAATELETLTMDWMAAALFGDAAPRFQWKPAAALPGAAAGRGGGVMQPSATEAMIVAMLAAQTRAIEALVAPFVKAHEEKLTAAAAAAAGGCELDAADVAEDITDAKAAARARLVAYCSDQSHFAVDKAARVLGVRCRKVAAALQPPRAVDAAVEVRGVVMRNAALDPVALTSAMARDRRRGLVPFFVSTNFGATGTCSVDPLGEVASLLRQESAAAVHVGVAPHAPIGDAATFATAAAAAATVAVPVWMNVDAAYAGTAALDPAIRAKAAGWESADSVLVNGSKWFAMNFNSNFCFFADVAPVAASLNASGVYLDNEQTRSCAVVDLKDYHLGLGRPFRSLKLLATLQCFGTSGIRSLHQRHIRLAQYLASRLLESDSPLFAVMPPEFGLVVFRPLLPAGGRAASGGQAAVEAESKRLTLTLVDRLNSRDDVYLVQGTATDGEVLVAGGSPVKPTDSIAVVRVSLAHPALDVSAMDALFDAIVADTKAALAKLQ